LRVTCNPRASNGKVSRKLKKMEAIREGATGRRIENPPPDQRRPPCRLRGAVQSAPELQQCIGSLVGVSQLVSGRCFSWLGSSHSDIRRMERKRLECKMWHGERLLYLCLNERHTQGDRDKTRGPESLASRVEDNLERFLLLHVPKLLSSISADELQQRTRFTRRRHRPV
jgi:hypothetical protein